VKDRFKVSSRRAKARTHKFFVPILAGATLRDRAIGCVGALISIALTGLISSLALGHDPRLPLLVAPIGASAVLLFAVPASPLAQPWPIIGGNTLSALMGVIVASLVSDPVIGCGLAVALAIAAMSATRCLHPPGGAAALTAIIGGPAVSGAGFAFPFVPVSLNCAVLVALGVVIHRFSSHSYPHVPRPAPQNVHGTGDLPPQLRVGFNPGDIDAALADAGEAFDIDREDLDRLLRRVELRALSRRQGDPSCADVMSSDLISVSPADSLERARSMLLQHGVRTLPVLHADGRLAGVVGLRELAKKAQTVNEVMRSAAIATPDTAAVDLLDPLTDGITHAVLVLGTDERVIGLVTQTDLLAALARPAVEKVAA
jgi:CBS domain-containing membrane protein